MRARAAIRFNDLKANVVREAGDEFDCSRRRYEKIVVKLGEHALVPVERAESEGGDE